ncbi:MAG: gliding motility lipoprotein GldH [Bacteroidaceae bacterium]|nr:gliding motility lipoprotein GldH [Bacteroidaceae bacterium]
MRLRQHQGFALLMVMIWLLSACNSQTRYHQFRPVAEDGWSPTDTIEFEVPLTDSLQQHTLVLQLRYTSRYPYKDLHLGLQAISPDSLVCVSERFHASLMDKQGYWAGSGHSGLYLLTAGHTPLPPAKPGTWHIKLFQLMGDSLLIGIHDVGIEISNLPTSIHTKENK